MPATAPNSDDLLWGAEIANADLLSAVAHLAWIEMPNGRTQPVDYRHLGAEELGSVYEALLELDPTVDLDERAFSVERVVGNDRKTTGSYYTSPDLVSALLDTALDPLVDRAAPLGVDPEVGERALLGLTVCDPACGSGGFLVAAARRIAHRLAEVRAGDDTPTPEMVQHAMRDVVGRCIYGVDLNDLAAELAKVSLWIEALEPGQAAQLPRCPDPHWQRPHGYHAGPAGAGCARRGIQGDRGRRQEVRQRDPQAEQDARPAGQDLLFGGAVIDLAELADDRRDAPRNVDTIDEVEEQRARWEKVQQSAALQQHRLQADAWCAAFVWPLSPGTPPAADGRRRARPRRPAGRLRRNGGARRASSPSEYRFFHWHLEFPEVFLGDGEPGPEGWSGGFSCMLGNPPWERVKLQEQEFFAARDPEIAKAPMRLPERKLIKALEIDDPALYDAYLEALREADGQSAFLRLSGRYPLNGRGDVNTYAVFTELFRSLTGPTGGPESLCRRASPQMPRRSTSSRTSSRRRRLAALYDFENRKPLFEGVHRGSSSAC